MKEGDSKSKDLKKPQGSTLDKGKKALYYDGGDNKDGDKNK